MIPRTPRAFGMTLAVGLLATTLLPASAAGQITRGHSLTEALSRTAPASPRAILAVSGGCEDLLAPLVQESGLPVSLIPSTAPDALRSLGHGDSDLLAGDPGDAPQPLIFARQAVGVYVHESNPITRLTLAQVTSILEGSITNWRQLGGPDRPLVLVTRRDGPSERWLATRLPGMDTSASLEVSSHASLTGTIARHREAIGFGPVGFTPGARLLRVSPAAGTPALWPCHGSVGAGDYPLIREIAFQLPTEPTAAARDLITFALSEEGLDVLARHGACPPAPADLQAARQLLAASAPTAAPELSATPVRFGPRVSVRKAPSEALARDLAQDARRLTANAPLLSAAYAEANLSRYLQPVAIVSRDEP